MDILRFLAARSLFPKFFAMLSVYFNDSVYHFRHLFICRSYSGRLDLSSSLYVYGTRRRKEFKSAGLFPAANNSAVALPKEI